MKMDTDKVTIVSVPIGVKNYTYLPGWVKFYQGDHILLKFQWNMYDIEKLPNVDLLLSC